MADSFVFFPKSGKRYRPNSFCIVICGKFVAFEENGHEIPQNTPKNLLSSFLALFGSPNIALTYLAKYQYITKIHSKNLMTSL